MHRPPLRSQSSHSNRILRRYVLVWVVVLIAMVAVSGIVYGVYRSGSHRKNEGPTIIPPVVPKFNDSVVKLISCRTLISSNSYLGENDLSKILPPIRYFCRL